MLKVLRFVYVLSMNECTNEARPRTNVRFGSLADRLPERAFRLAEYAID
jgi:hypothetical protein